MATSTPVKSKHLFTPVEIGLLIFFIGMVCAVVMPRIMNAENDANESQLRTNMHFTQIAVESYAADHGNKYPSSIDDAVKSYFPGGVADGATPSSQGFVNPYSKAREYPVIGNFAVNVPAVRSQPPAATGGSRGQIVYVPNSDQRSYAILGTTDGGRAIRGIDDKTTTVLSNLW